MSWTELKLDYCYAVCVSSVPNRVGMTLTELKLDYCYLICVPLVPNRVGMA